MSSLEEKSEIKQVLEKRIVELESQICLLNDRLSEFEKLHFEWTGNLGSWSWDYQNCQ